MEILEHFIASMFWATTALVAAPPPDAVAAGAGGGTASFLLSMVVVLVAAKLGGELMERLGQPEVLGELGAGIVLGNLTLVGFSAFEALKQHSGLEMAAEIGVILLLFEVGLDCHFKELMAVGRSALAVALIGVVAALALGYGVSALFLASEGWYVHLFVGATLTATSVGITARVLRDLRKAETKEARIILGAAVWMMCSASLSWRSYPD